MVNRHVQQCWPEEDMVASSSDPSVMRVWVTLPGKPLRPAEVLAEGEGNIKWIVENGFIELQL